MLSILAGKEAVGSYQKAFDVSLAKFAAKDPVEIAANSGAVYEAGRGVFRLVSLGQELEVGYPDGVVRFAGTELTPGFGWRLIILNYLTRADNTPLEQGLISYRETENGNVYYPAFLRESIKPLGEKLAVLPAEVIKEACLKLGGRLTSGADICAVFDFLPRFPVTVKIWLADEEVTGSANILFNPAANHYLHTEDIAGTGDIVSGFLIKTARRVR